MIISKASLEVKAVIKNDKIPVLNNIHITEDGTVIGSNGKTILLISPVGKEVRDALSPRIGDDKLEQSLTISEEAILDVYKNIPKDSKFKGLLEHCNVNPVGDASVEFKMTDGKRPKMIKGRRWTREYINYQDVLSRVHSMKKSVRVVLNRKRLLGLLEAVDKACPDSTGSSPVYLEFSEDNDIIVRAINYSNSQRALGIMQSYKGAEGDFLDEDEWEKGIWGDVVINIPVPCKIPKSCLESSRKIPKEKKV